MPSYPKWKVNFIHIPKAAGSSVQSVLGWDDNWIQGTEGHRSLNEMCQVHPEVKSWKSFRVIRDPIERIYSAWRSGQGRRKMPTNQSFKDFIFPERTWKQAYTDCSFKQFSWWYLYSPIFQPSIRWLSLWDWDAILDCNARNPQKTGTINPLDLPQQLRAMKIPRKYDQSRMPKLPTIGIPFNDLKNGFQRLIEHPDWVDCWHKVEGSEPKWREFPHENESCIKFNPDDIDEETRNRLKEFYTLEYQVNRLIPLI